MLCHSRVLSDALGTNKNIAEPQYNHQSQEIIIDTFLPSNPQIPFTFYQLSPVLLSFKAGLASNFMLLLLVLFFHANYFVEHLMFLKFGLRVFGRNIPSEAMFFTLLPMRCHMISICPITGDIIFD